jgi:hypothetical protein
MDIDLLDSQLKKIHVGLMAKGGGMDDLTGNYPQHIILLRRSGFFRLNGTGGRRKA